MKLCELAEHIRDAGIPGEVAGDGDVEIAAVNTLEHAQPGELSFLSNPKYNGALATTRASAVIVPLSAAPPDHLATLRCRDPYAAFMIATVRIHGYRRHPQWGISPQSVIAENARLGANANVGPFAAIGDDVRIGDNATIYPGVYVADRVIIGDDVILYPNVVVYDDCRLGHRVTIHAGTVIGEDGLGYAPREEKWVKIPQIGPVTVGDDVEIGANCAIDRATVGSTHIGAGTKFSNLIAIGHGTRIGEDCMFVAQVGVAGSVTVGRHVTLAGQVGVAGHLAIGDDAMVGAQSGVSGDVAPGQKVLGSPASAIEDTRRNLILMQRLPQMKQKLKELEKEVARLRAMVERTGDGPAAG